MRPTKEDYYLNIADVVSQRSTCLRRRYGAIIVKDDRIVATGYNGAPRGEANCIDQHECYREAHNIPHGSNYELCRSVHAEQNAIIHCTYLEMQGATLYLCGRDAQTNAILEEIAPCTICRRMIVNAGIRTLIVRTHGGWKSLFFGDA